jgi:uncharacterized protein
MTPIMPLKHIMKKSPWLFALVLAVNAEDPKPADPAAPAAPATPAAPVPAAPAATDPAAAPAVAPAAPAAPAPATGAEQKEVIGVMPGVMQFEKKEIKTKPGTALKILFSNKACPLQHNIIFVKPGTGDAVGKLADEMIQKDAAGAIKANYVPASPDIIAHSSKLIGTGQNDVISFTAPTEPGDYPYICTFPGHRFLMKGILKVAP